MTDQTIPPVGWITVDGELYRMDISLDDQLSDGYSSARWRKVFLLKGNVRVAEHTLPVAAFRSGGVQRFYTSGHHYVMNWRVP